MVTGGCETVLWTWRNFYRSPVKKTHTHSNQGMADAKIVEPLMDVPLACEDWGWDHSDQDGNNEIYAAGFPGFTIEIYMQRSNDDQQAKSGMDHHKNEVDGDDRDEYECEQFNDIQPG